MTITKPHEMNIEVLKSKIMDLTERDIEDVKGVSSSALITALKPKI